MKTKIYLIILGAFTISIIVLLGMYYSQDFTEELTFSNKINFDDISFKTTNTSRINTLQFAEAKIGHLKLQNNGYFPQKYFFPKTVGCIELKKGTRKFIEFYIGQQSGANPRNNYYYYPSTEETEFTIGVGETKEFDIYGTYNSYTYRGRIDPKDLIKENIVSIKIYQFSKKQKNPFGNVYYDYSIQRGGNCEFISNNNQPIKTISIV